MPRLAILLLILALVACGKKGKSTSSGTTGAGTDGTGAESSTTMQVPDAPASIPDEYTATFKKNWVKIEELGKQFTEQFEKAKASRGADKEAVNAAGALYKELADLWAEVSYAAQDESEKVQDAWSNYLRTYEAQVHKWTTMSKGLKEFSTVK